MGLVAEHLGEKLLHVFSESSILGSFLNDKKNNL